MLSLLLELLVDSVLAVLVELLVESCCRDVDAGVAIGDDDEDCVVDSLQTVLFCSWIPC